MHAHTVGGAAAASKRLVALALAVAGAVAVVLTATAPAAGARGGRRAHTGTAPALARLLSRRVDQHVIVLLKAQFAPALAGSRASLERADEIRAEQLPLIDQLRATHATHCAPTYGCTISPIPRAMWRSTFRCRSTLRRCRRW